MRNPTEERSRNNHAPEQTPERAPEEHGRGTDPMLYDDEFEVRDRSGRRWALRPLAPGRYDYFGYSWAAWAILWAIIIALIVWWAWAWSY